jgi:hypothetical protein
MLFRIPAENLNFLATNMVKYFCHGEATSRRKRTQMYWLKRSSIYIKLEINFEHCFHYIVLYCIKVMCQTYNVTVNGSALIPNIINLSFICSFLKNCMCYRILVARFGISDLVSAKGTKKKKILTNIILLTSCLCKFGLVTIVLRAKKKNSTVFT